MKRSSFLDLIFKNSSYIAVTLISLIYIASSLVLISKTGRSVYEILGTGALSLMVGVLINSYFRSMGIRRGEADERTITTREDHAHTVEEIIPFIDRLDEMIDELKHDKWWENVLYSMTEERSINTVDINGLFWSEIDYFDDYERILNYIESSHTVISSNT